MCNLQRFFHSEEWCDRTDNDCCYVDNQLEFTEFQDIVVNRTSIPDRILDGFEVIIQNNDFSGFFGCFRTASHGKSDIGSL